MVEKPNTFDNIIQNPVNLDNETAAIVKGNKVFTAVEFIDEVAEEIKKEFKEAFPEPENYEEFPEWDVLNVNQRKQKLMQINNIDELIPLLKHKDKNFRSCVEQRIFELKQVKKI